MTKSRESRGSERAHVSRGHVGIGPALVGLGFASGAPSACVASSQAQPPSLAPLQELASPAPRRPDGVALESDAALPVAVDRAEARGLLALRAPPSDAEVVRVVAAFFRSWQRESLEGLGALLTADAGPLEARGRGRGALMDDWRQRLQAHAYSRLDGVDLVRPDRIERWTWYDLAPGRGDAPERPPEMAPGELFVRVPVEVTEAGGDRFFGAVASMVLRRERGQLRIAAYTEAERPRSSP